MAPPGRSQRWRDSTFGRDILLAVIFKAVLVVALYVVLIRPALRPAQDPAATATAITGVTTAAHEESR